VRNLTLRESLLAVGSVLVAVLFVAAFVSLRTASYQTGALKLITAGARSIRVGRGDPQKSFG
jgi:hypothetical protein